MLDDILELIADIIFDHLFGGWERERGWTVLRISAAVIAVCILLVLGYQAIGWYAFLISGILAAVFLLAFLWDKQKSKERK